MKTKIDKKKAKKVIEETTKRTVKFTKTIFILIFVLMIVFTIIFSIIQFLSSDSLGSFLEGIATLSIGGFWAFFLGYFGWKMGEMTEEYFSKLKKK